MPFHHSRSTGLLILGLALGGMAPLHSATSFVSGDISTGKNWTNGLPNVGNNGTIAVPGTLAEINFGNSSVGTVAISHTAGAITGTGDINLHNDGSTLYQWTQSGGSVAGSNFMVINDRVTYELTGTGSIYFAVTSTGGSRLQVVNAGSWVQSGGTTDGIALAFENTSGTSTLSGGVGLNVGASWSGGAAIRVLNSTVNITGDYTATIHPSFINPSTYYSGALSVEGTGVLNFSPHWTGSLTQSAFAGTAKWLTALTQTGVQVDGTQVTTGNFADYFELTDNGATVKAVGTNLTEPEVILLTLQRDPLTGVVSLHWNSNPDWVYRVDASSNLQDWPALDPAVPSGGTSTTWIDPTAADASRRFYRVSGRVATTSRIGLTAIDGNGDLNLDRNAWLARNNLVYLSPPFRKSDSIPLGSGRVGAAMWIDLENGLTFQLNRPEGVPSMAGLGTLQITNLASLVAAQDYQGVLSLHDGVFTQHGTGLTVTSFFRWGGEELVVDVQGANPDEFITVRLSAFTGGSTFSGTTAITPYHAIASTNPANEATGENCIAIAGGDGSTANYPGFRATQFMTAQAVGRQIVATANATATTLTFKPNSNGSYRVVVPMKIWTGTPIATSTLKSEALAAQAMVPGLAADPLASLLTQQSADFGAMWNDTAIIRLYSADGAARYIEQMLALDSYFRIAAALTPLPAVGGGETRLFCWNPVGVFNRLHWYQNLRPINHANIASGVWRGNASTWDWLLGWLPTLKQHVTDTFPGYEGAGYPEYIDGQPGTAGSLLVSQIFGATSIAAPGTQYYTSRMMSTTLETVSAIITEYRYRQDEAFLTTYWPIIREGMLFHRSLLKSGGLGGDGKYHYLGVNARENNWKDNDDTPDVSNIRILLPAVIDLATQRGDTSLANKLNELTGKLPELPTNTLANKLARLNFQANYRTHPDGQDVGVIDWSAASLGNVSANAENPDLDAIWPANFISDASDPGLVQLANDTLDTRFFRENYDWHPTVVQAARMGRADIYKEALLSGIGSFMIYPQGFSCYSGGDADVQTEFTAVQTLGAHEALVQNHDGLLRLANAWPTDWEAVAWLPVEGGHRVALEVVGGVVQAATVDLGSSNSSMQIRNPWPGNAFTVRDLTTATTLFTATQNIATIAAIAGHRLRIERDSQPLTSFTFEPVLDFPNAGVTSLGTRILGKRAGNTFGFADPHLFEWLLDSTTSGLQNLGSIANADLQAQGTVTVDTRLPDGTGLSLANGYLTTRVLGPIGTDLGATFQLDVKVNAAAGYRRLIDCCVPGSNCDPGFLLDLTPDNKLRFICSSQTVISTGVLPLNTWAHVRVTYLAGSAVTIQIDGASETVPVAGSAITFSSDGLHLSIGADLNGGSRFTGSVANVRIDAGTPSATAQMQYMDKTLPTEYDITFGSSDTDKKSQIR